LKSNFFYSLQLLRNLKTLAENDGNQHFAEFIHYFNFNYEVLDDMKKLSKQITENYAQTGEANDEKVPIIISDDISYSGMQIRQESGMINRHVPHGQAF
jgi:hypothetical protein